MHYERAKAKRVGGFFSATAGVKLEAPCRDLARHIAVFCQPRPRVLSRSPASDNASLLIANEQPEWTHVCRFMGVTPGAGARRGRDSRVRPGNPCRNAQRGSIDCIDSTIARLGYQVLRPNTASASAGIHGLHRSPREWRSFSGHRSRFKQARPGGNCLCRSAGRRFRCDQVRSPATSCGQSNRSAVRACPRAIRQPLRFRVRARNGHGENGGPEMNGIKCSHHVSALRTKVSAPPCT
jgi:hypothetical protein